MSECDVLIVVDEDGEEYEYGLDAVQVDADGVEFIEIEDEDGNVAFEVELGDELDEDADEADGE
jgi:hypothetical protein